VTMRRTIVFGFIAGTCIVAPAFAQTPYDGLWDVTILTRAGSCEPSVRYPLTVTDGKVSGAADVSGSIGREGIAKVSIPWCLRQRPAQWQRRVWQMERRLRWNCLQRPLGSITTVANMSRHNEMPPVPSANRSHKGTDDTEANKDDRKDKAETNRAEQGDTANIKQNTTNAGFFKGRRVK
jgi:hypothetical protein